MATQIGEATIEVLEVKHTRTNAENEEFDDVETSYWHEGVAVAEWRAEDGQVGDIELKVGCWQDTDNDHAEWCAANEGANLIERCFGGTGEGDSRGAFARSAFPQECDEIGSEICALLREAAVAT